MSRTYIGCRVITPLTGRVFVNGYGISGTVVVANERWTVVQETMGKRTAVPTSNCEHIQF